MILPDGQVDSALSTTAHGNDSPVKQNFFRHWLQSVRREKQKNHRQMVRSRRFLVRSLLLGLTVAVSAIALGSYQVVRTIILDNLKKQALLEAHQGGGDIDQWLASRKAEVTVLANSPITRTMNWSVVEPYFKAEVKRQQDFDQLTLARPDGSYANTNAVRATGNIGDRSFFIQSIGGKISVSDPIMSRTAKVAKVFVGAPITAPSSLKPVGVVGEAIRVNRVVQVVNEMQHDLGGYAFALSSEGFLIAHPNPAMISTPENPGPNLLQSGNPAFAAIAQEMVSRHEGIRLIQLDGTWQYIAYVPLTEANWSVALVVPHQTIESPLGALNVLAGTLGLVLLLTIAGAWHSVQTYEQTRLRADQEALLNRLTTRIRESLDLSTIVQTTVTELSTLLDLQRVFLGSYNPVTQTLTLLGDSRPSEDSEDNDQLLEFQTSAQGDLADSLKSGSTLQLKPVMLSDYAPLKLTAGSYFALANPAQDGQTGFLIGLHNGALSPEDYDLLQAVSDQLAIAVTQARLYSQTQAQVDLLNQTLTKLNQAQLQLVQSEKMSSLGQLVAGIAHEINNPVSFIHGNVSHANRYAQELLELLHLYQEHLPHPPAPIQALVESIDVAFVIQDFPKLLESMQVGTQRIREIVQSLRIFSRLDEAEVKGVDIHEGIDCTLMILQSRLQAKETQHAIQVVKAYGQLPMVECYAGQLNQVFMNLLNNAIEALEETSMSDEKLLTGDQSRQPTISIHTEVVDNHHIQIRIADNGFGIPEAIQSRIFDPFFTTKAVGKGTGMGLAISYQIVTERHKGHLQCTSTLGQGTEFVIEIPIQQTEPLLRVEPT